MINSSSYFLILLYLIYLKYFFFLITRYSLPVANIDQSKSIDFGFEGRLCIAVCTQDNGAGEYLRAYQQFMLRLNEHFYVDKRHLNNRVICSSKTKPAPNQQSIQPPKTIHLISKLFFFYYYFSFLLLSLDWFLFHDTTKFHSDSRYDYDRL